MHSRYVKQKGMKKNRNRLVLIAPAVALLVITVAVYFWRFHGTNNIPVKNPATQSQGQDINYDPPTEQDQEDVNKNKEKLGEEQQPSTPTTNPSNNKHSVNGVLTSVYVDGDSVRAMAFIPGIVEDGGQCSFTFTKDGKTITKNSEGIADATTTKCQPLVFPKSSLSNGNWTITMRYNSRAAEGSSNTSSVEIQ